VDPRLRVSANSGTGSRERLLGLLEGLLGNERPGNLSEASCRPESSPMVSLMLRLLRQLGQGLIGFSLFQERS